MNEIGTLSEKSIHAKIKDYLEPNKDYQEIKVGKYIADIKKDNTIIEIQTKQFKNIVNKLEYYTKNKFDVTVVYPIVASNFINKIDPITNRVISRRKSSHKGVIQDCFKELYWIIDYIVKEEIKFKIILVEAEKYLYIEKVKQSNKKKSAKIDIIPTKIVSEIDFCNIDDLVKFIPNTLDEEWTAKEFVKHSKVNSRYYASGLKMLRELGVIVQVNKKGNAIIYQTKRTKLKTKDKEN